MSDDGLLVKNIEVKRGNKAILSSVSISIPPGKITGIIGPNGAGKSTLLRVFCGLVTPDGGEMSIDLLNLDKISSIHRAKLITYVGSELETDFPLTAIDIVTLGNYSLDPIDTDRTHDRVKHIMTESNCWGLKDQIFSELSSGEKQRVHFARALFQGSKWVCLDESFSKLDLHHQAQIGTLLRKYLAQGISFIFVSHDLNFTTDLADECLLIKGGRILFQGETRNVITEKNIRTLYPEADLFLAPHPISGLMKVYFKSSSE